MDECFQPSFCSYFCYALCKGALCNVHCERTAAVVSDDSFAVEAKAEHFHRDGHGLSPSMGWVGLSEKYCY